jgi:hypothetical protein
VKYALRIALLAMFFTLNQTPAQERASRDSLLQKPAEESRRSQLAFLIGSFNTETTIPPGPSAPKGATGKGTSIITWALDSSFLMIEEQSVNSLFGPYKGHGILGLDAPSHQFFLSMFNNFGDHPFYKGHLVGDTLMLETHVPMPGRPFDQKLVWYKAGDALKLRVLNDFGKGFVPALEQTSTPVSHSTK